MTAPTTRAGKALANPDPQEPPRNRMRYHTDLCGLWQNAYSCSCLLADLIAAVEAEAAADALSAARVDALRAVAECAHALVGATTHVNVTGPAYAERKDYYALLRKALADLEAPE